MASKNAIPEVEDDELRTGDVIFKSKTHTLKLTKKSMNMSLSEITQTHNSQKVVLDLPWRDVVCAYEKSSKSKSVQDTSLAPKQNRTFIIHYIVKHKKSNKLHCQHVSLESQNDVADVWVSQIEDKRKEGKPQKVLVIVNPIGGKGNARQMFEKKVRPLFVLAGIELVVKITERAKHALEIGKTFDVSSVDGVVLVGGDGHYMEFLNGLVIRIQEENGVDVNNPDSKLVPPNVRIGIIPAGTGNGVTGYINGVIDVITATLNIIRGETHLINIFAVHEPNKLIHYSGLLVGYGYFSDVIKKTDEKRWMKRARYPYVFLTTLMAKKRVLEIEVEILEAPFPKGTNSEAGGEPAGGWSKVGIKKLTNILSFVAKVNVNGEKLVMDPFADCVDLALFGECGRFDYMKFLIDFATQNKEILGLDFVEYYHNIRGFRFHVVQNESDAEASSGAQAVPKEVDKILDIDGEVLYCTVPDIDIRLHPHFLQVFSVKT